MEEQIKALQFKAISPEEADLLVALYNNKRLQNGVRIGPKSYIFAKEHGKHADDIYNMELKAGDIFVASYQRSGTTWVQELVWLIAKDLDYHTAKTLSIKRRYPFLERISFLFDEEDRNKAIELGGNSEKVRQVIADLGTPAVKLLAGMPSPRFVKTHLPMSLLPPKVLDTAKVVYVARDPRDVVVSCYYHGRLFKMLNSKISMKQLWNAFVKDLYIMTPYFEHVKEAWALRDHTNMLFLFYEDLSKDLPTSIRRVAEFLGKELTLEQIECLCDHLSFQNFKKNISVNYEDVKEFGLLDANEAFIRKGEVGGWRNLFDEEMLRDADRWIADNLRGTDLRFPSMEM